jgi:predicted aspartyl protease
MIQMQCGQVTMHALIDTGADISIAKRSLIEAAGGHIDENRMSMMGFTGDTVDAEGRANVEISIGGRRTRATFFVYENISVDAIIGRDLLSQWDARVEINTGVNLTKLQTKVPWARARVQTLNSTENSQHLEAILSTIRVDWESLKEPDRHKLRVWIRRYADCFTTEHNALGRTETEKHKIKLVPDAMPVSCPPRRLHPELERHAKTTIDSLLAAGHIRPSHSPWASAIVLARKKDGAYRFAVDYRRLNDVTVPDAYPMPRIDEALASMNGAKFFSTFDMASGYWQVEMEECDKEKTAFVTREGLFEWNSMPFGLRGAPATFCRLMAKVLAGLTFESAWFTWTI